MKKRLLSSLLVLLATTAIAEDQTANDTNNDKGKKIYEKACKTCHASGTAELMQAPIAHNKVTWDERLSKAEAALKDTEYKSVFDYLIASVKTGKGAMLPGGLCVDDSYEDKKCNDVDYLAAIKFMMSPEEDKKEVVKPGETNPEMVSDNVK